ncbi:MAG: hypothetical protein NC116_09675 [Clostridium sp.]|nr:hypothetical protein [Clostridium sp.]
MVLRTYQCEWVSFRELRTDSPVAEWTFLVDTPVSEFPIILDFLNFGENIGDKSDVGRSLATSKAVIILLVM